MIVGSALGILFFNNGTTQKLEFTGDESYQLPRS
jgi:hypothetical protein